MKIVFFYIETTFVFLIIKAQGKKVKKKSTQRKQKTVDKCFYVKYNVHIDNKKGEKTVKKWLDRIDELTKIVGKLITLALEIGTLVSVIQMILNSIHK